MIFPPTSRFSSASISSSIAATIPALWRYFSSFAARRASRAAAAATYSSSSSTCRRGSASYMPFSSAARSASFLFTPRSYLLRRSPSESLSGTSCSPETGFWFLRASDPDASVTESTSLCLLPLWPSSSSATSTKSATSSPKSPTFAKEFIERVVALARRRSVFESGTRVKRSSSIFARASMRANSRFANALDVSPTSPPSSSGASPSSCASSLMSADLDARRRASFSLRFCFADFPPSSKSSIAVGTILGGRYAPPALTPSSSSVLPTSASGLGLKRNGSSSSSSSPSRLPPFSFRAPPSAILRSLSIWYLSFLSIGRSFSRYARISTSRSTTGWSRTDLPSDLSSR
mmetsp:Transcript_13441/g.56446  ORF Transcript_13441/g.56446 Transcript_13441/m.56446 type:complete len:348 (+) Transcript_13441:1974-3017(+)